jgi:hypothetical protein
MNYFFHPYTKRAKNKTKAEYQPTIENRLENSTLRIKTPKIRIRALTV